MESQQVESRVSESTPQTSKNKWTIKRKTRAIILAIVVITIAALGCWLILKPTNTAQNNSSEKALTINDLENPAVELTSATSDTSVENLTRELKAKIDGQITAKENPIETVKELAGVLSNTINEQRQDQLTSFLEDFLANSESALWLEHQYDTPDQAQVNYWKAELYAYLIHNFQILMNGEFTNADGKPVDTTKEQLKYIDLYLALANDPASHPPIPEEYKDILVGYTYKEAADFSELKNKLTNTGVAQ